MDEQNHSRDEKPSRNLQKVECVKQELEEKNKLNGNVAAGGRNPLYHSEKKHRYPRQEKKIYSKQNAAWM